MPCLQKKNLFIIATLLLSACSAHTHLTATEAGTNIEIKKAQGTASPRDITLNATSFGNYEFKVQAPGQAPFYGILPLKFNGGYLAADIIFFAPATLYNLREVYPFYEFDPAKGLVRYRKTQRSNWVEYSPTPDEASRAKHYFEKQNGAGKSQNK